MCGQFVIETSTAPERFDECLDAVVALLASHAERIDPHDLDRARHQIAVRRLREAERALRRLEEAALDLFVHGRVRSIRERTEAFDAVDGTDVRSVFERLLDARLSLAITGCVRRAAGQRARQRHAVLAR
jgi:predicted Zn-dependent peptidase